MNKEEFKELQDETAFYIYQIEMHSKELYLTDLKYNYYFFDLLKEKIAVENEINCIRGMIENKSRNLNYEEFKKAFIKQVKENNANVEVKHSSVVQIFDKVTSIDEETYKKMEEYFQRFIREHHPVIQYKKTKDATMGYDFVKKMYRENNYSGMMEAYELNKDSLASNIINQSEYNDVALLYYEFKKKITSQFMQVREDQYPKNKVEVVKSQENIEKEKEQIKKDTEDLLKTLVPLQADYEKMFGEKFVLNLD